MSPYASRHLAAHLADAGRWADLIATADDATLGLLARWTEQGDHAEGLHLLQGMITHLMKTGSDPNRAACMMTQIARIHSQTGDYDETKRWLRQTLQTATRWRGRRAKAISLHELGSLYLYEDDLPNTGHCYRRALRICSVGIPIIRDEAAANLLGLATLARRMSRHGKAKRLAQRALRKAKSAGDIYHRIAAHRTLAISMKDALRYDEAEQHLAQAELAASLIQAHRESLANQETRGWIDFERSWLKNESQQSAEACFRRAIEEAEKVGLSACVTDARIGLAWCALAQGDVSKARTRSDEAKCALTRRNNRMMTTALSVLNAGVALQFGDLEAAERLYREIVRVCRQRHIPGEGSVAWSGLGAVLWRKHQTLQAERAWTRASALAKHCSSARHCLTEIGIQRSQKGGTSAPY